MSRRIGYYVHHHGDGHRQRALQIAACAPERFTLLGTGLTGRTDGLPCVDLPDDRPIGTSSFDGIDASAVRPQALHYAPYDHDGLRERVAIVTDWIKTARPALMVVDVSVEIAMLARLTSTPTIYVRQNGHRDDPAHLEAFRGAHALLCPFAETLDDLGVPAWVRRKTLYVPGLTPPPSSRRAKLDRVLVVAGKGGPAANGARIAQAARAQPDLAWRVAGPVSSVPDAPANLTILGWSDYMTDEIAEAGVVVGGAGNGLVNAVLAANRPFICLPEARPYEEQVMTAAGLEAAGAAVVQRGWPAPGSWAPLLKQAQALSPEARVRLVDRNGPAKAARYITDLADGRINVKPSHANVHSEEIEA